MNKTNYWAIISLDVGKDSGIIANFAAFTDILCPMTNIHPIFERMLPRRDKEQLLKQQGKVLWLTGLSGSGKSTIAIALERHLHGQGYLTQLLDGDNVRTGINNNLGFSEADRQENIRRIAEVAKLFAQCGIITICSFVSPTEDLRRLAQGIIGEDDFIEIYVSTPLSVCEQRDVKGLYQKARAGLLSNFTGIDAPFEPPIRADIIVPAHEWSVAQAVAHIAQYIHPPMYPKINIAVDGYAACGKSTIAKELAKRLGYIFIDSGAMYRAVTLYLLRHQIAVSDAAAIAKALDDINISFAPNPETGYSDTYLNGENVEQRIRESDVSNLVSPVSTVRAVRQFLVAQQQAIGHQKGVVMDGRDIGTVVFPDAELKLFVTARMDVRTDRRYCELLRKNIPADKNDIARNLAERDHLDSSRTESPLRQAADAILFDNSDLNPREQLNTAYTWALERIERAKAGSAVG